VAQPELDSVDSDAPASSSRCDSRAKQVDATAGSGEGTTVEGSAMIGVVVERVHRRRRSAKGLESAAAQLTSAGTERLSRFWLRSFASLENGNYRRFFFGQSVSLVGTWMQSVAQAWLVLQLTGSGTALGLVVAIQTLPVLLLAPYGGLLADRADKRRLLLATQSTLALLALTLGLLRAYCGRGSQLVARQVMRPQARWSIAR